MTTIERYCPTCEDEQWFEQPPCLDGHLDDCPEWCCVQCGAALLIGVLADAPAPAQVRRQPTAA